MTVKHWSDHVTDQYPEGAERWSAFDKQVGGDHYKGKAIQPIEYILANNLGFCEGNIVKYVTRYSDKGGVADLRKVIHYAEMLIEHLESK